MKRRLTSDHSVEWHVDEMLWRADTVYNVFSHQLAPLS